MEFHDLKKQYIKLKPQIDRAIQDVIDSSAFILGKQVSELEESLADYAGRRHCISCASGTDALVMSLRALGIGPGDAVFTTDFSYFSSASCIALLGAVPVFADIDRNTFNISAEKLEEAVEEVEREGKLVPKAVIPVDLFGLPADYDKICGIAKKHGMYVLEDAAQSFGSEISGRKSCSFGDISATSFFPAKPLGCYGDGGAVFTDSDEWAERIRSLRANGRSAKDKYDNLELGYNSRLDTLQAAILMPKFNALKDYELNDLNKNAALYGSLLDGFVRLQLVPEGYASSWASYSVLFDDERQRDEAREKLKDNSIPSMIYYPRGLHQQKAFSYLGLSDEKYPDTVYVSKRILSLPMHPYLEEDEIKKTAEIICSLR